MKKALYLLFSFISLNAAAQNVSGLYIGTLVNDSTKREQRYELALSEYRDKITGYSYTTFVVNDTFYYSVKRVKGTKLQGEVMVEDVKMIANNFPESAARGVRQIVYIPLNGQDSLIDLQGRWKTTQTKHYYSLSGGLDMKRDSDSSRSSLITQLKELDIIQSPAAYLADANPTKASKSKPANASINNKQGSKLVTAAPVLTYEQRKTNVIQVVDITSDSLSFSFYDNGIVDGDTISVFFNDAKIISGVKLTEAAARRTVQVNTAANEYKLVLVAENLGSIPPNTGLLVIQDGSQKHEIRFSADLQNNAAVVLRKKAKLAVTKQ